MSAVSGVSWQLSVFEKVLAAGRQGKSYGEQLSTLVTRLPAGQSMDTSEFEAVVDAAVGRLPDWVREALNNIEILVLDTPAGVIEEAGDDLLGLYTGTPLPERDSNHAGSLPDVIYIFRLPHLALGLPDAELREEIGRTTLHEIAHYFGLDDAHLDDIGWG